MKKFFWIPFLWIGCGGSHSEAYKVDQFREEIRNAPELLDVDASLSAFDTELAAAAGSYRILEKKVASHARLGTEVTSSSEALRVHVNANNVLIVNGTPMTRNDFSTHVNKNGLHLCEPVPHVSVDMKADYDTAVWVLDMLYSHGCADVSLD